MHRENSGGGISDDVLCAEYEAVYRYALCLCRNEAEAQDITQDTFLRAMRTSSRFEGSSSLYTWLCSIAKNLWIDRCRKQNREISCEYPAETESSHYIPLEQRMAKILQKYASATALSGARRKTETIRFRNLSMITAKTTVTF